MVITGERHRTIYPQSSVNWSASLSVNNTRGEFSTSFSGIGGNCGIFTLNKGKIFSPKNEMVGSYLNNETFSLSGNIGQKTLDLYKNNTPLYLGLERTTTGDLNKVILNDVSGQSITLNNLLLIGKTPETTYNPFLVFYAGQIVPFTIYNSGSSAFTIFSGSSANNNFTLSGIENLIVPASGNATFFILNSLTGTTSIQDIPILINSSIGERSLYVQVSGRLITDDLYYLSFGPENGTIYDETYNLYNLSFRNPSGINLSIGLNYVSGITGKYYRNIQHTGFQGNGLVSGFISGSGYLLGNITGEISGFNSLSSQFEYGTGTGLGFLYKVSDNKIVSGEYSVLSTGVGNAIFTKDIQATGYSDNIIYSGFINFLGGNVTGTNITGNISGLILDELKFGYTETGNFVNFINYTGKITGNFQANELEQINLESPQRFVTGNFSEILNLVGYGLATGEIISGKYLSNFGAMYEPGDYIFYKHYVGKGSGKSDMPPAFNPVKDEFSGIIITTGLISGLMSVNKKFIGCEEIDLSFNLPTTGIPNSIGIEGKSGNFFPIIKLHSLPLNSGEFVYENNTISGTNFYAKRTELSHINGVYDNIFQEPFFTGRASVYSGGLLVSSGYAEDFLGWKQPVQASLQTGYQQVTGNQHLVYVSGKYNLFNENDNAIFNFKVTGDSDIKYPFTFRFKANETGKMIYANLYESGRITNSWSGGYYANYNGTTWGETGGLLIFHQFFTGNNYTLEIKSKNILPSTPISNIYLSHSNYLGCEKDYYFTFQLNRTGYTNYTQSGELVLRFDSTNNNLPYISDENLESGFMFNYFFDPDETIKHFSIPIYPNNKYEKYSNGTISLNPNNDIIINNILEQPNVIYSRSQANFILRDDEIVTGCSQTIVPAGEVIYPYNNNSLDFRFVQNITYPPAVRPRVVTPPPQVPPPVSPPSTGPTGPQPPDPPTFDNDGPDGPDGPGGPGGGGGGGGGPVTPPSRPGCSYQVPTIGGEGLPLFPGRSKAPDRHLICCSQRDVCGKVFEIKGWIRDGDPKYSYQVELMRAPNMPVFERDWGGFQSKIVEANDKFTFFYSLPSQAYIKPGIEFSLLLRVSKGNFPDYLKFLRSTGSHGGNNCTSNYSITKDDGEYLPPERIEKIKVKAYPQGTFCGEPGWDGCNETPPDCDCQNA